MENETKALIVVLLIALAVRLPFVLLQSPIEWDSAAYAMNAKFFSGNVIYFEDLRPPLLPVLMAPVSSSEAGMILVNILLAVASVYAAFLFFREISGWKPAVLACMLLSVNYLFVNWSKIIAIESGEILFVFLALYFFLKAAKNSDYLYAAGAASGLAFLYRYPLALVGVVGAAWYFYSVKPWFTQTFKERVILKKQLWGGALACFFVVAPWLAFSWMMFGNPLHSILEASIVFSTDTFMAKELLYYFENAVFLANPIVLLLFVIGLLSRKNLKEGRLLFVAWLLANLVFFQFQGVKEVRYLVPVLPVICFFSVEGAERLIDWTRSKRLKGRGWMIVVLIAIFDLIVFWTSISASTTQSYSLGILDASFYLKQNSPPDSRVYSSGWPITAYYSERRVKGLFAVSTEEEVIAGIPRVDYVLLHQNPYEHPIKKEFLDSRPELEYIGEWGKYSKAWLYKVKDEYKDKKPVFYHPDWDPRF
jgi:4-amino-4-deoxy-L-arabinose transferase-like glycosyltransferase